MVHKIISAVFSLLFIVGSAVAYQRPTMMIGASKHGAYRYARGITVPAANVDTSDQTNFPVLVKGTYSYLATVANGGTVKDSSGYDIGFYSDVRCSSKLAWETEVYNATSGDVAYWVSVPTLSHSTDTTFYMCYSANRISSDQSNKTAVWDANYKAVYHLNGYWKLSRHTTSVLEPSTNIADWDWSQLEEPAVFVDPLNSNNLIMWYGGMASPLNTGHISIGLATATVADPYTWTKFSGNPVLTYGPDSWDGYYIRPDTIFSNGDGTWTVHYTGSSGGSSTALGMATCTQTNTAGVLTGMSCTKYAGNPTLTYGGTGRTDEQSISQGSVVYNPADSTWYLVYAMRNTTGGVLLDYRCATSPDGITWTKPTTGVTNVMSVGTTYDSQHLEYHDLRLINGLFYLTYEAQGSDDFWALNMAVSTNPCSTFTKSANNRAFPGSGYEGNFDFMHTATGIWFQHPTLGWMLYYVGAPDQPYLDQHWKVGAAVMVNGDPSTLYNPPSFVTDSTSNANDLTLQFADGASSPTSGGTYLGRKYTTFSASPPTAGLTWFPSPFTDLSYAGGTIEWWMNPTEAYNDNNYHGFWGIGHSSGWFFDAQKANNNNFYVGWNNTAGSDYRVSLAATSGNYPQNTWSSYAFSWASGGNSILYRNGASIGTHGSTAVSNTAVSPFYVGLQNQTAMFRGGMSEFRISNIVRSSSWLATQFANQNSPATFYTVGAQQ
jgi:hypothetical protein